MRDGAKRVVIAAALATAAGGALAAGLAAASETITYSYDAKGRLVATARSGTVNNNVATTYTFDRADNRNVMTVTGAP